MREWEDGGVVYDATNGNTHLLDPLGLELLDLLRQRSWSLDELVQELHDVVPPELVASDLPQWLQGKLEQLMRLDLVKTS